MSFVNQNDFISFRYAPFFVRGLHVTYLPPVNRHHIYKKLGHKEIDLAEMGPRFEMRIYQIKLGTIDMDEAENEWVLRPYRNTAKKQKKI